jgi:hypothetical protein
MDPRAYPPSACYFIHLRDRQKRAIGRTSASQGSVSSLEDTAMPRQRKSLANKISMATLAFAAASAASFSAPASAQAQTQEPQPRYQSQDPPSSPQQQTESQAADGQRQRDLPAEAYAVVPGTKFLVRLEGDLGTKNTPENTKFKVKTLEPLEAGSGIYLPPGAEITGHVSRSEPAGVAGRAKLYLTFDEIRTKFGRLPIVAEVVSVPGDHSVKAGPSQEGLIEGRHSKQQDAAEAAAAGAAIGAIRGVKDKDKKEAAEGAALGALTAYLMESGRGHEINLPKGAKLELELERALYLLKE